MENIIKLVTEKTGLSNEQAKSAVETVLGLVKDKLPASVGSQVDALLEGKEFDYNAVLKGQLENLKGEASEKFEDLKGDAAEKIEDLKEDAQNLFKKLF
jgi:uncharacterized protein YjbJ (UPF0337 family)